MSGTVVFRNREGWVEACEQLLRYYKGEIDDRGEFEEVYYNCPLCLLASDIKDFLIEEGRIWTPLVCNCCIWVAFEGETCGVYAEGHGYNVPGVEQLRQDGDSNEEWWDMRIKMLGEWIARLKKEIAEEKKDD